MKTIECLSIAVALADVTAVIGCWLAFVTGCLVTAADGITIALFLLYCSATPDGSMGVLLPWFMGLLGHYRWLAVFLLIFGFSPSVREAIGWPKVRTLFRKKPEEHYRELLR